MGGGERADDREALEVGVQGLAVVGLIAGCAGDAPEAVADGKVFGGEVGLPVLGGTGGAER